VWGIWGMRVRALCFRRQRRKIGEYFFVEKAARKLMSKKYVGLLQRRKKAGKVFGLSRLKKTVVKKKPRSKPISFDIIEIKLR